MWLVKVYVYVIKHWNQLALAVILEAKNVVRYVKFSWDGMDYGVHAVAPYWNFI
jgi:hypothetical protein